MGNGGEGAIDLNLNLCRLLRNTPPGYNALLTYAKRQDTNLAERRFTNNGSADVRRPGMRFYQSPDASPADLCKKPPEWNCNRLMGAVRQVLVVPTRILPITPINLSGRRPGQHGEHEPHAFNVDALTPRHGLAVHMEGHARGQDKLSGEAPGKGQHGHVRRQ
jgi:hypothetical protein